MPAKKTAKPKLGLPKRVLVGDLFKVKDRSLKVLEMDCERAGYDVDLTQTFTAIHSDDFGSGNRERIRTTCQPWFFYQANIEPAWNSDQERLKGLTAAGWEQNMVGKWVRKRKTGQ